MKRVYREVRVAPAGDGWSILLDARTLQTPARAPLVLPRRGLADAVAAEWDAQAERILPDTMSLMRLAATAIDVVAPRREQAIREIVGYAGTDLLCYRAERPADLVARQTAVWQPLVDWATLQYDAPLKVTTGVVPTPQATTAMSGLHAAAAALDVFWLTGLHAATTACGSIIIGLALVERRLDAEGAWHTSQLDEIYQVEKWGEDAEAAAGRAALKRDLAATCRFMELMRA